MCREHYSLPSGKSGTGLATGSFDVKSSCTYQECSSSNYKQNDSATQGMPSDHIHNSVDVEGTTRDSFYDPTGAASAAKTAPAMRQAG